ncbi:nitroreductase [Candidatus Saganbacteria bacterium CG08_land_8_20_14_0_20_45_16]|uniref:Nitroreductase n=1 Tax=Candidatus Saganbacteria bacterium CG08_land_8_20_14_0_20_45_16 TaxID=2014293 RepID=A0A2H0Y1B0_UNCSA|nr:MAG: nitroreductase [Candidatus Saganbacteria bacterium CG08_land_8_20_14_0_20_45_16]
MYPTVIISLVLPKITGYNFHMRKILLVVGGLLILISSSALATQIISLPKPVYDSSISLEKSIAHRRSERSYLESQLSQEQLSQILWAAEGITDQTYGFRSAPSAGALYPLTIYVVEKDGVFRYLPDSHKLAKLFDDDKRPSLVRASLGQVCIREAPVSLVIAANFRITQAKYGARAFRYVCMEAGHVAENIHLQAVALGLASLAIGAFWDDVIKKDLDLPENQDPLYIIPIGYVKQWPEKK